MRDAETGEPYDVVVAGGGPAGCAAALVLARAGRRVLLADAGSGPRKLGETLVPAARLLLADLGVAEAFLDDGHPPCYGVRSAWGGGGLHDVDFIRDPYGLGRHLDRALFDRRLRAEATAAGVEVLERTAVRTARPASSGWTVAPGGAAGPGRAAGSGRTGGPGSAARSGRTIGPSGTSAPGSAAGSGWTVELDGRLGRRSVRSVWVVDATGRAAAIARRCGARHRRLDRLITIRYLLPASVPSLPDPLAPFSSVPGSSAPVPFVPAPHEPFTSVPGSSAPVPFVPAPHEPFTSVPGSSAPVLSGPAPSAPASSGPAPSAPGISAPASSGPAPSAPGVSMPALSMPTLSMPTLSMPTLSMPAPAGPARSTPGPAAEPLPPSLPTAARPPEADGFAVVESVPDGWWFTSPTPDGGRLIGFFTDADLPVARQASERFGDHLAATRHVIAYAPLDRHARPKPHRAAAHTAWLDQVVGPGWVAAGDAAVAFDPLSSQGVLTALYTGLSAGQALVRRLDGDGEALGEYAESVETARTAYLRERGEVYAQERRWPERSFWSRRLHGPGPK